jgi:HEXXH motif-containing protein
LITSTHRLTGEAFTAIASGDGDPAVVRHLREVQHSKHLMLLHAVTTAAGRAPESLSVAAFRAAYRLLTRVQATDPDVIGWLLGLPHIGGWAHDCLVRLDKGLLPDFGYLASAAATAAIRAGVVFELDVPVRDGQMLFPGLGWFHVTGPDQWIRLHSDGQWLSIGARTPLRCASLARDDGSLEPIEGWRGIPVIRALADGHAWEVLLETTDRNLDRFTLPMATTLTATDVASWRSCVQSAWQLLVRHHGWVAAAVAEGVRVIVPLTLHGAADHDSETTPAAFGAVATSWSADPVIMAETMVHEFQHIKLCGLLDVATLIGPCDELVYAPWRQDPRPAVGLLHGLYAHLGIARFWSVQRTVESDPDAILRAQVTYERWRHTIEPAARRLQATGCLTPAGNQFAGLLCEQARRLDVEPAPGAAREIAGDVALEHWLTWQLRHTMTGALQASDLAAAYRRGEPFRNQALPGVLIRERTRAIDSTVRSRVLSMRYLEPRRYRQERAAGVPGLTDADILLLSGKASEAAQAYRDRIAGTADEQPDAWIGLALASQRMAALSLRQAFATHLPLMVDLDARLRAQGDRRDPLELAAWFA